MQNNSITPNTIQALILDFDNTLFDTSADNNIRKSKKGKDIVWNDVYSLIPMYQLYDGWIDVFSWCKANGVKIAIISTAKTELIKRTLVHFGIHYDVIVGWQLFHRKPDPKLVDMALAKINVAKVNVLSIGDSPVDLQMSLNSGIKFLGAIWDSDDTDVLKSQCTTISDPKQILSYISK